MTEDIIVSVKGLHTMENVDEEEIEVISAGKYYFKNGKHYILYEEMAEGSNEAIQNRITLRDGILEVRKKGPVSANMVFERGRKNMSWYNTPFGNLLAGVDVVSMEVTEEENLLEAVVQYELEVNYERVADCRIQIRVMAKDSGLFHLQ
ncbi:MAG: DUF1934 domain-containing protein [Candidatus Choladocola sp.]|nr:DUF1934 domain-containing protein [Candidatus Choladocola sp.]